MSPESLHGVFYGKIGKQITPEPVGIGLWGSSG